MDWTTLIAEIGGGLPAVIIIGLAWALWHARKRENELVDRLIETSSEAVKEGIKREVEITNNLNRIIELLKRSAE